METLATETEPNRKSQKTKAPQPQRKEVLITKKIDSETAKLLNNLKEKANKKDFGRKVKEVEIIHMALQLVTQKELSELQEASLTHKDRLEIAFEKHQKANGKTTMDQFIGLLLKGEIEKP